MLAGVQSALPEVDSAEESHAALAGLQAGVRRIGAGWCFGGGVALSFGLDGDNHEVRAIFYGRLVDDPGTLARLDHEVYGTFAALDSGPSPESVGSLRPDHSAAGAEVRFFITNVANARTFNVTFGLARVKLVASDMGRFKAGDVGVERGGNPGGALGRRRVVPGGRPRCDSQHPPDGQPFRGEFYPHMDTLATVRTSGPPTLREYAEVAAAGPRDRNPAGSPPSGRRPGTSLPTKRLLRTKFAARRSTSRSTRAPRTSTARGTW